ncbi:MAG: FKBP-type peptidyl-prolyl cis-trans isomerase [Prevotellaceae bacterium]|jgi:FKBP-type peptidyl-prolyl cis-trans isomerase SlyD|nr:FKBP-type peptidyl-prolyl cis-trans isomerase [Prevotellaceae bacterium]
MKISANKLVSAAYELYVAGDHADELELVEKTDSNRPLNFIFGAGMMLPKFEDALFGLQKGDKFAFVIDKTDAYGEYMDENVIELERSIFEMDGKLDETVVFAGNVIPMSDSEGNRYKAVVVSVSPTNVTVDLNHPLAGDTLHFKGEILDVREPSDEDLAALTGGCGCGGCGGCNECGEDCDC